MPEWHPLAALLKIVEAISAIDLGQLSLKLN